MPIYIYRCENCGVQFERQQKFSDSPLKRCPECNKNALRKVYQPVGIVFKGSGFYSTDHRSPSRTGRNKSGSKSDEHESKPTKSEDATKKSSKSGSSDSGKSESSKE